MKEYTKEELDEFRKLFEMGESRLDMPNFFERVGWEKCDVMFQVLLKEIERKPRGRKGAR